MKKLFALALLVISTAVFAGNTTSAVSDAGWDNLSASQRAEILKQVAAQAEQNKKDTVGSLVPEPQKVDEWVAIGERVGKMMTGAAREVGMALNDFMNTPVGMITMGLIIWKVMGGVLVHLFGGVAVWCVGAVVMTALYRRFTRRNVIYDQEKTNWFGNHPKLKVETSALDSDEAWGIFLGSAAFTAAGLICIFSF